MSLQACAELVRKGDPDRFLATMAAPPAARAVLFPVFAFNLEVARAPWVTAEPMIAQMRLQWWADVLEEIGTGGAVRRHEVTDALAPVLDVEGARLLGALVEARRADIEPVTFADADALRRYLDETAGNLAWAAARALGSGTEAAVRGPAWASGLANYLAAIPELEARGRQPLPDGRPEAVRALAAEGLARLKAPRPDRAGRLALLAAWRAGPLLRQAVKDPGRVGAGHLRQSEFARRAGLLARTLTGR